MKNKKIILVSSFLAAGLLGFFAVKAMSKDKKNPAPCPGNPSKTYIPGEQYASDPCKETGSYSPEEIPGREDFNF